MTMEYTEMTLPTAGSDASDTIEDSASVPVGKVTCEKAWDFSSYIFGNLLDARHSDCLGDRDSELIVGLGTASAGALAPEGVNAGPSVMRAMTTPSPWSWANPDRSLLADNLSAAPTFPSELLGEFWAEWCEEVAAGANAPVDYVGASLLTVGGAMIGNARVVTAGGWSEPPIMWTVLIGNPSSGKSPALDPLLGILERLETTLPYETDKIVIDDATVKAMAEIAQHNPKGLLLFRDELSGWWSTFRQFGGEATWLKAFGARPHTVNRSKEPPIRIPRLSVSVIGGSQPDMVRSFIEAKSNGGFASRWLYVSPDPVRTFRLASATNHTLAEAALVRLHDLSANGGPLSCLLAPEAMPVLQTWVGGKRAEIAQEEGIWAEWLGKQGGVSLRLALIMEHLWWAAESPLNEPPPQTITLEAYQAAIDFIDGYSTPMAARTMNLAMRPPEDRAAAKLARLLRNHGVNEFNAREVRRNKLGPVGDLAKGPTMAAACEVLEAAHLIRHTGTRAGDTAGRRAATYEVNPLLSAKP